MSITVTVGLLSGKEATVEAGVDETVGTLQRQAQTALGVGRGRLLDASGNVLDVGESIKRARLQSGASLALHINRVQAQATGQAYAAILGDGSVVTRGDASCGGDSRAVQDQLKNVQQVQASYFAFAAILGDGSLVTWGKDRDGGDSRAVQDQLKNVQVQASDSAFAAILGDGSLVTWGKDSHGGDSSAVQDQLKNPCLSSALWPLSPAASRLSAWLEARLDSHRVLMRMEEARQSMGDLSSQLLQATAAFGACEEAAHSNAVQKRQQLIREAASLEAQTERATKVLEIAAPRRRECEVVLPSLQEAEESPEQWGAILTLTVLSSYAAPFAPAVRAVILKELKEVLADSGVPTPANLYTSKYLQHLLPLSFLQKAISAWPQSQLLQSTLALELSGSLCSLIFDPVGSGYDWLQDLHTQRNPAARGGTGDRISSEFDKHLQRLMESRAREPGGLV
ncbi:hypothetical protein AK812_SmicGene21767 [Symbiodinium microadriaticum]|uniref:Ubiquitin-like domain-containing protein n=1 Tax=Symbiodinium microadriaticum TaxID=2951 RepID=A0A1Q9DLM4_SYMMI|nr:hypothetical protein AK812_SmicGene21767 [Symbiodinium microadriaticum]